MIRGYPTVPIGHENLMKCDWLNCAAGLGLAGSGRCFLQGIWWWHDCPNFVQDPEFDVYEIEGCKGYWTCSIDGNDFDCEYEFAGEISCEDCIFGPFPKEVDNQ